jgi:hypothetical protein
MSDNYKTIRAFHDLAVKLMSDGIPKTTIQKEAGIGFGLMNQILKFDPVAVKIRSESIEKIKSYVEKKVDEMERDLEDSKPPGDPDPGPVNIPYSVDNDLLSRLGNLINEFQGRGWKLDVMISRIYKP